MARVYIGGVGGSGKTRVTKLLAEQIEDVSILTGSDIMMKAARGNTREELRQLPNKTKEKLRISVIPGIYRSHAKLIAEGHFYLAREETECFNAFLLVEAPVEKIVEFRRLDVTRGRPLEPEAIVREKVEMSTRIRLLEDNYGLQVVTIENDGSLGDFDRKVRKVYECSIQREGER